MTKFSRSVFKKIILLIFSACIIFLTGCNKEENSNNNLITDPLIQQPADSFPPDFFLEKGSDSDSSYISFAGKVISKDSMKLDFTGWGIIEYGLFIHRRNLDKAVEYTFMGYCGTVFTRTWQKVNFTLWLTSAEADTVMTLKYIRYPDTLSVSKTSANNDLNQ